MNNFKLGSLLKDKVTGFTGIATARVEYLNGCIQYCLAAKAKDNVIPEGQYFDQQQIEFVNNKLSFETDETGGPQRYQPKN